MHNTGFLKFPGTLDSPFQLKDRIACIRITWVICFRAIIDSEVFLMSAGSCLQTEGRRDPFPGEKVLPRNLPAPSYEDGDAAVGADLLEDDPLLPLLEDDAVVAQDSRLLMTQCQTRWNRS